MLSYSDKCTGSVWLAATLIFGSAPFLLAADAEPKFEAELLHVATPIHITPDVHVDYFSSLADKVKRETVKATIAAQVECRSDILRGAVYDVAAALRTGGVTLPKGSCALYSPQAQLLYIRSTADDLEHAKVRLSQEDLPRTFSMDVQATVKSAGHDEQLLEMNSVQMVSDKKMEINAASSLSDFPRYSF